MFYLGVRPKNKLVVCLVPDNLRNSSMEVSIAAVAHFFTRHQCVSTCAGRTLGTRWYKLAGRSLLSTLEETGRHFSTHRQKTEIDLCISRKAERISRQRGWGSTFWQKRVSWVDVIRQQTTLIFRRRGAGNVNRGRYLLWNGSLFCSNFWSWLGIGRCAIWWRAVIIIGLKRFAGVSAMIASISSERSSPRCHGDLCGERSRLKTKQLAWKQDWQESHC